MKCEDQFGNITKSTEEVKVVVKEYMRRNMVENSKFHSQLNASHLRIILDMMNKHIIH